MNDTNTTVGQVINTTVGTIINKAAINNTTAYASILGRQDVSINMLMAAMVAELFVLVAVVMLVTVIVQCVLRSRCVM